MSNYAFYSIIIATLFALIISIVIHKAKEYETEFWKIYHLHTSEIIRIYDFVSLWLRVSGQPNVQYFCNYSGNYRYSKQAISIIY